MFVVAHGGAVALSLLPRDLERPDGDVQFLHPDTLSGAHGRRSKLAGFLWSYQRWGRPLSSSVRTVSSGGRWYLIKLGLPIDSFRQLLHYGAGQLVVLLMVSGQNAPVVTIHTFYLLALQKSTMEGLIPGNRIDQFKDKIKEGCVYTIDRFDLLDPKKSYRSVDDPLRIGFTMRTLLTEVIPRPENFPMFAYTALPFNMLTDRVGDIITLSDIVGLVTKVTPILPPSGKAKSHKRQVHITDGRFAVLYEHISDKVVKPSSITYRFIARAVDAASTDSEDTKIEDLYFFGPRGEAAVGKEALTLLTSLRGETEALPQDLLAITGKEFNIVATPRRESLDSLHPHLQVQIAEPIFHTNVPLRQGSNDPPADQACKDLRTSVTTSQVETAAGTSTPLSSTKLAPQHLPSPSSSADKAPLDSPARPKQKAASADKNPKAKKELRFSKDS
ncbi:hypothetical protein ACQ4PT_053558 [Festuca glaucescens]